MALSSAVIPPANTVKRDRSPRVRPGPHPCAYPRGQVTQDLSRPHPCACSRQVTEDLSRPSSVRMLTRAAPVGDRRRPRAGAELGVDPPDVVLHGLLRQEQPCGDLPVGLPVRDERHDLGFPRRQPLLCVAAPGVTGRLRRPDAARPAPVKRGPLARARSGNLAIVHLTSGRGRWRRTLANAPNPVGNASITPRPTQMRVQTVMADLMLTYTQTDRCACPRCGYVVPSREVFEMKSSGSGWSVKNCLASCASRTTTEPPT